MTKVKICGVTRVEDAIGAARAGADFVGINFWPGSKRHVDARRGAELARAVRDAGAAQVVGVFVNASVDEVLATAAAAALDIVQLHGDESRDQVAALAATVRVWKAIPIRTAADVDALASWELDAVLLDTPTPGRGGSGVTFDWSLARAAQQRHPGPHVLAGGLTPDNVGRAVTEVAPWAVDVASGVEASPGVKDAAKVTAFVAAAQRRTDVARDRERG